MAPRKPVEAFPTGVSAHKKCTTCGERYHVYQFPFIDKKAGKRDSVCLSCAAEAQADRLARIRPTR